MLSVKLENGVVLKALDLGKEIQLRIVRLAKNKQRKESWRVIEKVLPNEPFIETANKQFKVIADLEKTSFKPLSKAV